MKSARKTIGFTVVELLVVIIIIAILTVGGISLFSSTQQKTRDSQRLRDMRAFVTALEQISLDRIGGGPRCGVGNGFPQDQTKANFHDKIVSNGYIEVLPTDPINEEDMVYRYAAADGCEAYEVSAFLEHPANASKVKGSSDFGQDDRRYELGTPNCLGRNEPKCVVPGLRLDTSTSASDIEYE